MKPKIAPKTSVKQLLYDLDNYARETDIDLFGLPVGAMDHMHKMEMIVTKWLGARRKKQELLDSKRSPYA